MKKCCLFSMLFLASLLVCASPLPAQDVFQLTAVQLDPNHFALDWHIKPGYFLYQQRIRLVEKPESNFHLGAIRFPKPLQKKDKQGRIVEVYRDQLTLNVPILGEHAGEALLDVHYQGCSDAGFCYPPQLNQIKLTINDKQALTQVVVEDTPTASQADEPSGNEVEQVFFKNNLPLIMLSFFGFGLLLAFTPCVLPMVPVLSGIIVGHGKDLSTRKAFFLSLSYVLSMAVTYAVAGAIVALMGSNLQIAMQSPWIISLFSLIFVLLALSMFNFYDLRLPVSWQSKLASVTRSQAGGHYLGAAVMGCLSTLILSPCVTAPLIGALGYIAHSGNVVLGSLALFSLGLGMGSPLLVVGTSAGKLLPKAGHWMNAVKAFFGVMLLAVAIYLMQRILPATLIMALWGSLLIFSGIYMDALSLSRSNAEKFRQGLGIILLVYGLLILIGASRGNTDPLQPLTSASNAHLVGNKLPKRMVKTVDEAQLALAKAKEEGKPVMVDFYADWCASCKVIDATTLQNPHVQAALDNFVVLKIDVTANTPETKALLRHFDVVAPPTFLFFDAKGKELNRVVGDVSVNTFSMHLKQASAANG